jgi:transcriptional regulator with XRE-family HTH domain
MPAEAGAPPEEGIGQRLRYCRGELDLTVEALSRLTKRYDKHESKGVSPTSIARYESGESLPGARELRLLCEAFDVPPGWLLLGDVPNAGKGEAQQALLQALAAFVHETQTDIEVGSHDGTERMSEWKARTSQQDRAAWLAEARKPG